ncbi:MAG: hypothetical protein Q7R77_00730 [Candidatus Daviesbacteria bacterium]|nr:hypothetical protein [Candidatus Daviesbacteria bacterium]
MKKLRDWLENTITSGKIIAVIFCFNALILFLHLFKASFVLIDNTTILLMVLVLLTPFASQIKKIKWGDLEVELEKSIKELKEKAEKAYSDQKPSKRADTLANELHELAERDGVLAFAKLRIEIEVRLKRLFTFSEEKNPHSMRTMVQTLAATGVIDNRVRNMILEITSILNRVVHGDIPSEASINNVLDIGVKIINELDDIFYEKVIKPTTEKVLSKKELEDYMDAIYEVTSVIPLVKKPYVNKRILNQEQLDLFLEGYDEYAEFLVEIKKVK